MELPAFVCGRRGMAAVFRERRAGVVWVAGLNVGFNTEGTEFTEA
jgi:hypothetical protein